MPEACSDELSAIRQRATAISSSPADSFPADRFSGYIANILLLTTGTSHGGKP
jgi:hypothetical protein